MGKSKYSIYSRPGCNRRPKGQMTEYQNFVSRFAKGYKGTTLMEDAAAVWRRSAGHSTAAKRMRACGIKTYKRKRIGPRMRNGRFTSKRKAKRTTPRRKLSAYRA